jgi:membrane protein required for colicin V production
MPVTVLDIVVILVVLISAVLAMIRGFVREVLSIASWVAAAAAAYLLYKPVVPLVQPYVESGTVATIIAAAAIFFIALIVASYITMRVSDFVIDSRVGAVDRVFGFAFGAVRGVLLVVIALLFFNWLVPQPPAWVTTARTKPMLDDIGEKIMAALPEDAEATILKRLKGGDSNAGEVGASPGAGEPSAEPPADGEEPAGDEPVGEDGGANYRDGTRQGLDQLIENNAGD